MKKYQVVLQDEIKDCGVSCIQMIIKYYGGYVKKSNLLEMTKTNKKGTTAYIRRIIHRLYAGKVLTV